MGLNISAGLVPTGGGAWETHDASFGKGGFRSVADVTARDAITTQRRSAGMLVHTQATDATYRLGAGLTNADWTLVSSGAITAGNGLTGTTALAVLANGTSIEVSGAGVRRAALSGAVSAAAGSNVTAFASGDFGALPLMSSASLRLGLAAGSGSGVASAAATGNIRGSRGAFLSAGGTGFQISARRDDDLADIGLLGWDSTAANLAFGGTGVTHLDFGSGTDWRFRDGTGTTKHAWTQTAYSGRLAAFTIDPLTASNSTWSYAATASASGFSWDFFGQNAATTGGNFTFTPGTGGTTGGSIDIRNAAGTSRFKVNDTGIGFFGSAPVAKPAPTGSRAGNAALASLLTSLANLGLITDSTSA